MECISGTGLSLIKWWGEKAKLFFSGKPVFDIACCYLKFYN